MPGADAPRILVTRSQPGADALARALGAAGFASEVVPLVTTEACGEREAGAAIETASAIDAIVYTSGHAVEHFFAIDSARALALRADTVSVAIGAATAAALRRHGVASVQPEDERTEGILALPVAALSGGHVLIVGGEGGRRALDAALLSRGTRVTRVTVYRRVSSVTAEIVERLVRGRFAAAVVSSVAGGEALHTAARAGGPAGVRLLRLPIVVPSQRVKDAVTALGFAEVHVSAGAGAHAVIATLRTSIGGRHGE